MNFTSIVDILKITLLLPIGLMAYTLEKLASKINVIGPCWFYAVAILCAISTVLCLITLSASVSAITNNEYRHYDDLRSNLWVMKWFGSAHLATLAIAALVLLITVFSNLDDIYNKVEPTPSICEATR